MNNIYAQKILHGATGDSDTPPSRPARFGRYKPQNQLLAEMIEEDQEPLDYRLITAKIEAILAAEDAEEIQGQQAKERKLLSGVGPYLLNKVAMEENEDD